MELDVLPPGKVSRVDVNSHASAHAMEPKSESPRTSQGRRPTRIFDADSDSHRRIVSDDHLLTVDPGADPSSGGGGGGGTPRRQRSSETIIISENDHTGSPRPLRKKVDVSRDGGLERGEASLSNGAEDDKGGEPRATGGSCGGQAPKAPEFQEVVAALASAFPSSIAELVLDYGSFEDLEALSFWSWARHGAEGRAYRNGFNQFSLCQLRMPRSSINNLRLKL